MPRCRVVPCREHYGNTHIIWKFAPPFYKKEGHIEHMKFSFYIIFWICCVQILIRRVWRYQRGSQNPYIEEEQTTQWPKEKVLKDKERSTKHTYKTKERVTWSSLKTGGELNCSGRLSSSCSTSDTRHVNLVTNPVISHDGERTGKCLRQVEHIHGHMWHRYSIMVNQVMVATVKLSKWWLQIKYK